MFVWITINSVWSTQAKIKVKRPLYCLNTVNEYIVSVLLTTAQTLCDDIPQMMCLLNLRHKDTECKTVNKLCAWVLVSSLYSLSKEANQIFTFQ